MKKPILYTIILVIIILLVACEIPGESPGAEDIDSGNNPNVEQNIKPVAVLGDDITVATGTSILLDGSNSSDANNDTLTYNWSMTSCPDESASSISNTNIANPTFVPDLEGVYVIELKVHDGELESDPVVIEITSFNEIIGHARVNNAIGYSVEVEFKNPVDKTTAEDINNYSITYWDYEITVESALLNDDGVTVTLQTESSFINTFYVSEQLEELYMLSMDNIKGFSGVLLSDQTIDLNFDSLPATGIANWGSVDNYKISGTLKDQDGEPLPNHLLYYYNNRLDGAIDDVALDVYTDENGNYSLFGLPSWGEELDGGGAHLTPSYIEGYESISHWPTFTNINNPDIVIDIVYPKIVDNTKMTGFIRDNYGNGIPRSYIHLLYLNIPDDTAQGPCFNVSQNDPDPNFTYNEETGEYFVSGVLAGGTYKIHAELSGYTNINQEIYITPGETKSFNMTVFKETNNNLLALDLISPESGSSPTSPVEFSWNDMHHDDVHSYVIAIWSEENVDITGEYPVPKEGSEEADMLKYIVQDSANYVFSFNPADLTGINYIEITNNPLQSDTKYYWGLYSYMFPYDDVEVLETLSGESATGLWSFIAP